ncbi:unnamed protein product, partial [Polarella glacialis]
AQQWSRHPQHPTTGRAPVQQQWFQPAAETAQSMSPGSSWPPIEASGSWPQGGAGTHSKGE